MKRKNKNNTFNIVVLLFVLMALTVSVVVIGVANQVYTNGVIESYGKVSAATSQVVASSVSGNTVRDILKGDCVDEYNGLKRCAIDTVRQTPDLERVFIYSTQRDTIQLIIDTDDIDSSLGKISGYPSNLASVKKDLRTGNKPRPFVSTNSKGHSVMIALVPVFDVRDNCVCYVGCEMNMDSAYSDIDDFTVRLAVIVTIPTVLVALLAGLLIRKRVLAPISKLDSYLNSCEEE